MLKQGKKNFWNHARFLSKVVVCLESWLLRKFWFGWFMRNGSTLCTSGCLGWAFKTLLLQRNAFFAHIHWIFTYSNFVSPIQSKLIAYQYQKTIQKHCWGKVGRNELFFRILGKLKLFRWLPSMVLSLKRRKYRKFHFTYKILKWVILLKLLEH